MWKCKEGFINADKPMNKEHFGDDGSQNIKIENGDKNI